jgi:hypothetical protein
MKLPNPTSALGALEGEGMPMKHRFRAPLVAAVATALVVLSQAGSSLAAGSDPKPIPGGIQIPGGPLIHVFAPGPVDLGFQGENAEPSTITDFKGFSAMAYIAGTVTDADGNTFNMQNDMRVYRGTYVSEDGSVLTGTFAFI